MTKNKRFTLVYGDENPFEWDLMDNQKDCLIVQGNGIGICKLLNELNDENKKFKEANQNLQFKIIEMLDFIKENDGVTRQEMADWWNNNIMGEEYD